MKKPTQAQLQLQVLELIRQATDGPAGGVLVMDLDAYPAFARLQKGFLESIRMPRGEGRARRYKEAVRISDKGRRFLTGDASPDNVDAPVSVVEIEVEVPAARAPAAPAPAPAPAAPAIAGTPIENVTAAWGDVDRAIAGIVTATPMNMGDAVERLLDTRETMKSRVTSLRDVRADAVAA